MTGIILPLNIRKPVPAFLFILAACLTACDPKSFRYELVTRVIVRDNIPYVYAIVPSSFGIGMGADEIPYTFVRQEPGESWQEVASPLE